MHKLCSLPISAPILSFLVLLHAGSSCAENQASRNPSSLSKSTGVYSRSGLFGSSAPFPTGSGFHSASSILNGTSHTGSELTGSGTASTPVSSGFPRTGPITASASSRASGTSGFSTQNGFSSSSENVPQSFSAISFNSSNTPLETGQSLSSTSQASSGSQGAPGNGTSSIFSSQSQTSSDTIPPTSSLSKNGTSSITSSAGSTPAPGSTGTSSGPSATFGSTGASAPSGSSTKIPGSASGTSFDVPNPTQPGGIPITSLPSSGPAAASQKSIFGGILLGFVSDGRNWVSDITLPAIKTQAINEIENLKGNTENIIKNLGGHFPPTSNTCSGGSSRKRLFDPLGAIEGLAGDALGLANCIDNIVNDISNEIGPITGPPPPADIINSISTQLDALEKAGEEEENDDDNQSTTDTNSNTKGSASTSSSFSSSGFSSTASSRSSASSARSTSFQTSSHTSSAVSGCPTFVYPDDDLEEWEGPPLDGNINKRTFGVRGRFDRRPWHISDGYSKAEENPDVRYGLMKREQAAAITSINSCNFPNGEQGVQPGYSGLRAFKGLNLQRNSQGGRFGAVYDAVPKWYVGNHSCGLPDSFAWYKTDDERPDGIPARSEQSVDHVCEFPLTF
ncbi:MAG: hypothetical protein ASARMPRED_002897 [Alectoria sarmentosa]|nr:MAG: hypothetical protein ASARMPRED_002897 [Alectoria sarmentosa]